MKNSAIEWTHHTFNPWWGCTKVSAGCDNCYAANLSRRYGHNVWGHDTQRRFLSDATWNQPLVWNSEAAAAGAHERVFCASMGDVFECRSDLVPHRLRLLNLIGATSNLNWLLLTKRPHSIKKLLPHGYEFPANVWLGTTVENQEAANKRIKHLLEFKAPAVRFLSCEPLLGPVDIRRYLERGPNEVAVNWVIAGGESEHGARPMNPEWAESLLAQCQEAGVPFLFKQWGSWALVNQVDGVSAKRKIIEVQRQDGSSVQMVNVGKKVAGRVLNNKEWTDFPLIQSANSPM